VDPRPGLQDLPAPRPGHASYAEVVQAGANAIRLTAAAPARGGVYVKDRNSELERGD
jgi:hypothetical protein